jgi:hypothetical protein
MKGMIMATGCGKKMVKYVPRSKGYGCFEMTVKCGDTSPTGFPWQCGECAERNAGVDWRMEAALNGENLDSDY